LFILLDRGAEHNPALLTSIKMRTVIVTILAVLLVAVYAKPHLSLEERIDAYLKDKVARTKRVTADEASCNGKPCCEGRVCAHGTCTDVDGDNFVYKFGWVCEGADCGTTAGKYAGIGCDVDATDLCQKKCLNPQVNGHRCSVTAGNLVGFICYDKDYNLIASTDREMDLIYGIGTSDEITAIAREYERKSLTSLLSQLVEKLEEE